MERLAMLTSWGGRGDTGTDWVKAEEGLGTAVPPDFRELGGRFPAGTFQGYLNVRPSAGGLADLRDRVLEGLRHWRDQTLADGEIEYRRFLEEVAASEGAELLPEPDVSYPFPLWPEPGGIFPWAEGAGGEIFFWLRTGSDPHSWPVVWCHGEDLVWERFNGTATEFIIALVTGQIDHPRLGSLTFPPPPRFDQWEGLRFIPQAGAGRPLSDEEIERIKALAKEADWARTIE